MFNALNDFILFFDRYNSTMAFIALVLSIYSVYITKKAEKYEVLISYPTFEKFHHLYRYSFTIVNNSNKSITIKTINFNDTNKNKLVPIPFDIYKFYDENRESKVRQFYLEQQEVNHSSFIENLTSYIHPPIDLITSPYINDHEVASELENILMLPHEKEYITVYFNTCYNNLDIEICSDKPINKFFKSRVFSIHFNELV